MTNPDVDRQGVALLVIDVQRGLLTGDGAMVDADAVIDRINLVMRRARSAAVPVILIQHESVGGALAWGSAGWQLSERLDARPGDLYLRKTATDSFHNTALHQTLGELGVGRLVVCGFQSEFCVDTTTRRALALGYPVTLVADGHSTAGNGLLSAAQISAHHNVTLTNITSFGPRATALPAGDPGLFAAAARGH